MTIMNAPEENCRVKIPRLQFTGEETARFGDVLNEVAVRVREAENVFSLLACVQKSGDYDGHFGIADMASLAAKALSALRDKELEDLSELHNRLMAGR